MCGKDIPMHLGDYATKRSEVECFCVDHLPDKDVRVFTLTEDDFYEDMPYIPKVLIHPKGWKAGIRYLTENAKKNADMNEPNIGEEMDIEDR